MDEAFYWGIKTGDLKSVKEHVKSNSDLVNKPDNSIRRATPVHFAADYGQNEILNYLVSEGANFNATDSFGITPLQAAIYEGHLETVKLLISLGAKKDIGKMAENVLPNTVEYEEMRKLLNIY